jgi:trehalose 6-phosphate synthase/phosphatase
MNRLILVSCRLPITVTCEGGRMIARPSGGGLATGLRGPHRESQGLWIGWPGDVSELDALQHAELKNSLAVQRVVPVHLSREEVAGFYEGFSNAILWPLLHGLLDRIPLAPTHWETYREINQRFADAVAAHYRDGDVVWVHDYQLALVPGMLREKLPGARIGFFLHVPFPAADVFRVLPWRTPLLEGLLGADLVGFHAASYARHFAATLAQVLWLRTEDGVVPFRGREVRVAAFPMGIDAAAFSELGRDPGVLDDAAAVRAGARSERIVLGVDRLDYTKGLQRRLLAIERMFELVPTLRGKVRFVQVAVPSREGVPAYAALRRAVEELVGRINGAYGTMDYVPVHYLYRSVDQRQLVALYRAASVMLVTSLRDGMNLVAKEFIAAREDEDGVLVLSEFAGAATELGAALMVNPYDLDGTAQTIAHALAMRPQARRARMRALRRSVAENDIHAWTRAFLAALSSRPQPHVRTRSGTHLVVGAAAPAGASRSVAVTGAGRNSGSE